MPGEIREQRQLIRSGRKRGITVALLTGTLLAGCSQVPDAVNPVEWYNSSVDFFSGDDQETEQVQGAGQAKKRADAGADQKIPNLASVEQQKQRDDVRTQGLVADVEGRKYAPAVARQGEAVNALGSPPAKPPAPTAVAAIPTQPAPPAMPSATVTSTGVSATPAMPATDPLASTGGQQDFQATMARRLAEIRARANQGTGLPEYVAQTGAGNVETVVISADGIQSGYGAPAAPTSSVAPVNSELTYIQRPLQPIAQGAVKVATIMFKNGSSKLSAGDRSILANVRKLQKERGGRLRVIGHASSRTRNTDPVRHKMINYSVSTARADAVAHELLKQGLDKSALQVDAVSDSAPVYFEFMPSGEAGNRRAEIYLES
jgi:flagellar motor protein MotB